MTPRELRDYINKLEEFTYLLKTVAFRNDVPYRKAVELRIKQDEYYKRWLFYKKLQEQLSETKGRVK